MRIISQHVFCFVAFSLAVTVSVIVADVVGGVALLLCACNCPCRCYCRHLVVAVAVGGIDAFFVVVVAAFRLLAMTEHLSPSCLNPFPNFSKRLPPMFRRHPS